MEASNHDPVLSRLTAWGQSREDVRVMILTSSRCNPAAPRDLFSDYDVILGVRCIAPYLDESWLQDFGPVLVLWRDPVKQNYGHDKFAYITQYETGLKIDFTVGPTAMIATLTAQAIQNGAVDKDLDVGYQVLLDKDQLTAGLPAPTYRAYTPTPPTEIEYCQLVETIFHEATYVAKHLWRGDLMAAKYNLDHAMKGQCLRQMLEWRMEVQAGWNVKTGAYGKGLQKRTPPHLWQQLEATYVGAGTEENFQAMFATLALFRQVALEVGQALGYSYPQAMDDRATAYLRRVQQLPSQTVAFPW